MNLAQLEDTVESVPVGKLKVFPGNPRVGDKKAIAQSLETNGQFAPIVVQRSTDYVLAGNHTYLAASEELQWTHIKAVYVDVDDHMAKRIVAAANRTAMLGGFNDYLLADLLQDIADDDMGLEGTGYDDAYLEDLLTRTGVDDEDDDGIEMDEGPTSAAYIETEDQIQARHENLAKRKTLNGQALGEIVFVMPMNQKVALVTALEALREHLGDQPNGPLIHHAVNIALAVCDNASHNSPPVEWQSIVDRATPPPVDDADDEGDEDDEDD